MSSVIEGLFLRCPLCGDSSAIVPNTFEPDARPSLAHWYDRHLADKHRPSPEMVRCAYTPDEHS